MPAQGALRVAQVSSADRRFCARYKTKEEFTRVAEEVTQACLAELRQSVEYQARAEELDARQAHLNTVVVKRQLRARWTRLALRACCGLAIFSTLALCWAQRHALSNLAGHAPTAGSGAAWPVHEGVTDGAGLEVPGEARWQDHHLPTPPAGAEHFGGVLGPQGAALPEPELAADELQGPQAELGAVERADLASATLVHGHEPHGSHCEADCSLLAAALGVCAAASDAEPLIVAAAAPPAGSGAQPTGQHADITAVEVVDAPGEQLTDGAPETSEQRAAISDTPLLQQGGAAVTTKLAGALVAGLSSSHGEAAPSGRLSASVRTIILPRAACIAAMRALVPAASAVLAWLVYPPPVLQPVVNVLAGVLCALLAAAMISALLPGGSQPGAAAARSDAAHTTPRLVDEPTEARAEGVAQSADSQGAPRPSPLLDVTNQQQSADSAASVSPPALRGGVKHVAREAADGDVSATQHAAVQTAAAEVSMSDAGTDPKSPNEQEDAEDAQARMLQKATEVRKELMGKINAQQKQLVDAKSTIAKLKGAFEEHKTRHADKLRGAEEELRRLQQTDRSHKERAETLESDAAAASQAAAALQSKLATAAASHSVVQSAVEAAADAAQAEAAALRGERDALLQQVSTLQQSAADARSDADGLRDAAARAQSECEALQQELSSVRALHDAVCVELVAVRADHESAAGRADDLAADSRAATEAREAQVGALQQELADAQADLCTFEVTLADVSARFETEALQLQTEAQQAAQSVATLQSALHSRGEALAAAEADKARLQTESAALRAEVEHGEAKSVKLAEALTILHHRMESLGAEAGGPRSGSPAASPADSSMLVDAVPAFVELYEELVAKVAPLIALATGADSELATSGRGAAREVADAVAAVQERLGRAAASDAAVQSALATLCNSADAAEPLAALDDVAEPVAAPLRALCERWAGVQQELSQRAAEHETALAALGESEESKAELRHDLDATVRRADGLEAELHAVRDMQDRAVDAPRSLPATSAADPLSHRDGALSTEGSVASLGFGEAGRALSLVHTAPQKRAWLERHASLLRTCDGAQRVRVALHDCGARVSVALSVESRAERALHAVEAVRTGCEQQLSQISSLMQAAQAVGAAELAGGGAVPRITGGASGGEPGSPPAVAWQASQSTAGSGAPPSLLEGCEHVRQLLEEWDSRVQEDEGTPYMSAAGTPGADALPTHGGPSLEYMMRDPTGVLAAYGVVFNPRRLSAAVQARVTLQRQGLEDTYLTAAEAEHLARHCGRTLADALVRLHTPSLGASSSDGGDDSSPVSGEWVQMLAQPDKFAAQQEQVAAVQECARHICRHLPLVLEAVSDGITLQEQMSLADAAYAAMSERTALHTAAIREAEERHEALAAQRRALLDALTTYDPAAPEAGAPAGELKARFDAIEGELLRTKEEGKGLVENETYVLSLQKCQNLEAFLKNLQEHNDTHQRELGSAVATLRSASDALFVSASELVLFLERAGYETPAAVKAVLRKLAATAHEGGMASVHSPGGTPLAQMAGAEERVRDWLAATPSSHRPSTGLSTRDGSGSLALSALAGILNSPSGMPSARDLSLSGALRVLGNADDDAAAFATCEPPSGARHLRISPPDMDAALLGPESDSDSSVPTPHLGRASERFHTPLEDAATPAAAALLSTAASDRYATPLESEPSQASVTHARREAALGSAAQADTQVSPLTGLPLGAALQSMQQAADVASGVGAPEPPAATAPGPQLASKLPRAPKKAAPEAAEAIDAPEPSPIPEALTMPSEPTPAKPLETSSPLPSSLSAIAAVAPPHPSSPARAPPPPMPTHVPFHQGAVRKGEESPSAQPLRTSSRTSPLRTASPAQGHPSPPALPAPAAAASPLITHPRKGSRAATSVVRRSMTESEWHDNMAALPHGAAAGALGSPFTAMALTPPTPALTPGAAARLADAPGLAVLQASASPLLAGRRLAALDDRAASEDRVLLGSVAVSGVGLPHVACKAASVGSDEGGEAAALAGKPFGGEECRSPDENASANS